MKRLLSISIISIMIDQLLKLIISANMNINQSVIIINNFFKITYVNNTGAAWSILDGSRVLLILLSLIALVVIYFLFIKDKKLNYLEEIGYGLLIGGIIGNLIDRIFRGYVVDYLDFKIFNYDYPIFNIADICIVVSVILLIIIVFKGEKNDNSRRKWSKNR